MARADERSGARRRRWPWVLLCLAVLAVLLAGLAWLARPLLDVKPQADAARDDLGRAEDALRAKDLDAAKVYVASARTHVDAASQQVNGFGGDVWRWVPVAGGAVGDARHLVDALDQATSIAQIGTELYPDVMASDTLVQNTQVDLPQLERILAGVQKAGMHLHAAVDDLDAVEGNTPFVGDAVLAARDSARDRVEPLRTTYDEAAPVLDALPEVLGADGDRTYIVAIMNPAELRYSGGATLTLVPMTMSDGKVEFGDTVTTEDIAAGTDGKIKWPKVKGNPFHTPGKTRVVSATFSPYWSQSGEELLRAWEARFGGHVDGLVAVDLQALARMMTITGPVQVDGVGELNSDNLVKTLAGSYDFYSSEDKRRAINASLVPVFREKLFQDGQFGKKFEVLAQAAEGRHFALYFRDRRLQDAFEHRDLAGDLSATDHDYIGVFTQNTNASKSDFWQARHVESDVQLREDGSADVTLTTTVQNASPPFTPPWTGGQPDDPANDPRWGYYTRWAGNSVAVFLPRGADVEGQATIRNVPFKPVVRSVLDRPYFYRKVLLPPGGQAVLTVKYHVPSAATVDGDRMTYRLDIDPQGTVVPQSVVVNVHPPEGYQLGSTPEGWTISRGTATYTNDALDASPRLAVTMSKG